MKLLQTALGAQARPGRDRILSLAGCPLLACVAFLALAPLAVYAHAQLLRSDPANRAELARPPKKVKLWFNELLDDGFKTMAVFPADQLHATARTNLVEGKPEVDRQDRTHLTANLRALAPGEYVVEWRVLSRDGHSAPGRLTFRVLPAK